jgi:hypothetical protein
MNKTRRIRGRVVHVGTSRSGGFWAVIKDQENTPYFAYGLNFLDCRRTPRPGWTCEFSPLPATDGRLHRATEVRVLKSGQSEKIIVIRFDGRLRIVMRGRTDKVLGELRLE